jgi:hypothetical protein
MSDARLQLFLPPSTLVLLLLLLLAAAAASLLLEAVSIAASGTTAMHLSTRNGSVFKTRWSRGTPNCAFAFITVQRDTYRGTTEHCTAAASKQQAGP